MNILILIYVRERKVDDEPMRAEKRREEKTKRLE
tara:strand:- start:324 stop:425 length:102 start_codon:yes stop_codon:yes gene_type:complete